MRDPNCRRNSSCSLTCADSYCWSVALALSHSSFPTELLKPTMTSTIESVLRVISGCTSLMMILSPSPAVYRIFRTRTTGHTSIISLASLFANCHVWMLHGYLTHNMFPVFATFLAGDFIALAYLFVYLRATAELKFDLYVLAAYASVLIIISLYALLGGLGILGLNHDTVSTIMGYIATCVCLMLYSSPFIKIREVLRTKSAESLPIHMIIAGGINNSVWVAYTPMARLWFLLVANSVCWLFAVIQLLLYVVYHPSRQLALKSRPNGQLEKEGNGHLSVSIDGSVNCIEHSLDAAQGSRSPLYQVLPSPLGSLRQ